MKFRKLSILGLTIALAGAAFALTAEPASATPVCGLSCFVNGATGNDANNGTAGAPFQTIRAGVDAAVSGGTVTVAAGTYAENVVISTPLTAVGAGQGSAIVIPANSDPYWHAELRRYLRVDHFVQLRRR